MADVKTRSSFVTHLESAIDSTRLDAGVLQTMHNSRPLWVRYDLKAIKNAVSRDDLDAREQSMWRYRELLPYESDRDIVSLGETMTPILKCDRLGAKLGLCNLFIKDESRLPTGSFKARGMAMAVTMAKSLGVQRLAAPTAGNAGGALAAYAARAGLECFIFMPKDTPIVNRYEAALHGAHTFLVNGLINDCGRIVGEGKDRFGWFDVSTLKEPYRIEGKKTMGLELAEQFDWELPDVILYPTGGGTGLIGMWKAFQELIEIGWLDAGPDDQREKGPDGALPNTLTPDPSPTPGQRRGGLPRMISCQSSGCAPIVNAYDSGERFAEPVKNPHTIASGLRVPAAVGDFMILDAVRESGGRAFAAEESRLRYWMQLACETEGIALCPESAACIAAAKAGVDDGWIDPDERIVIFNTGAAQKYVEVMETSLPVIENPAEVDWNLIEP